MSDVVERYLTLGLRLGRRVDGLVDAYYGPPELAAEVEAEDLVEAATLAAEADALAAEIAGADELDEQRRGWLGDQVKGLRTYAGVLAGEEISYLDEVEGCYGVRPEISSEDVYRQSHEQLDELLPGEASLLERYDGWRQELAVPADRIVAAYVDVVQVLRSRTALLLELPEGEEFVAEAVRDEPWWAFNYYQGDLRSRIVLNVDTTTTAFDLVNLAAHEAYPGHHTEHAVKEQVLIRDQGRLEEGIQLVPTPQALVSEGIAEVGLPTLLDEELRHELAATLAVHGLDPDLERSLAIRRASQALVPSLDAALMIHEHGVDLATAQSHIERWGLRTPERAAQSVRFITDPTWRAYAVTYTAGYDLCQAYVDGDPARLRTLLTEQVRVGDLIATTA